MKKTFVGPIALFLLCALPVHAQDAGSQTGPKVAVIPFAALTGDVPQRAGMKAAGMLANELKNADAFALVDLKRATPTDPDTETLEAARKAVAEAQTLRSKRKFRAAEEALQKAIDGYKQAAGSITDISEVQDAWVLLSAVQFNTGRDEEGTKSLQTALALAPGRELPLAKTSPLFTRVVNDQKAALQKAARGSVLVESTPSGATVFLNGVSVGATPLQVTDVPAGLHLWRVQLPSGESTGGAVQVAAQKQAKVMGQTQATDPESKLLATLAQNKIDQSVLEAAKQQSQAAGADLVIFGALSKNGKNLVLDSFVLESGSGKVKRLPRSTFDTELLSAGMEFYNLVGQLAKDGLKVGADTRVPGQVADGLKTQGAKVVQVAYGQSDAKAAAADAIQVEPASDTSKKDEARKPLEKKKRAPLRR